MKTQDNAYIASMCKATGDADPLRAISKHVDRYRKPGMTLESLATTLGVSAIVEEMLPFDGGVFPDGANLIIKINSDSIPTRRRFTLAHELAHVIISVGSAGSARRCLKSNPLEDACDFLAAELLMPIDEALVFLDKRASLGALLSFSERFNVSLHAAAVRISELKVWKESIYFWKWSGSPKQLWYVGQRFWFDEEFIASVIKRAIQSRSVVETEVLCNNARGQNRRDLKVQKLGSNYALGFLST